MDEITVSKEHMDSLKALANTNMQIGVARNTLIKLQENETSYIEEREKKVLARIYKLLDDSKDLLGEAHTNYGKIQELYQTVFEFSSFLSKAYDSFTELLKDFREKNDLFDNHISDQEAKFAFIKKQIDVDKIRIENDRQGIERAKVVLNIEKRKIDDDRATLGRAIARLKENKI